MDDGWMGGDGVVLMSVMVGNCNGHNGHNDNIILILY